MSTTVREARIFYALGALIDRPEVAKEAGLDPQSSAARVVVETIIDAIFPSDPILDNAKVSFP
jgi:hypothetical protein